MIFLLAIANKNYQYFQEVIQGSDSLHSYRQRSPSLGIKHNRSTSWMIIIILQ